MSDVNFTSSMFIFLQLIFMLEAFMFKTVTPFNICAWNICAAILIMIVERSRINSENKKRGNK